MTGLVLNKVSKTFDGKLVLDDICLELADGELMVLLGPSGCGKSTILRIIAGLEEADSGEVYIGSKRVDKLQPRERNVALVFQNYSLYPHMTIERNLAFPLKVAGMSKSAIASQVQAIAEKLGLSEKLKKKPGQLSGGQRQRVALGRAIVREPSIFLLDEPLSNLDAELRVRMRQEIVRIQRELKRTMVHVTHDQAEAMTMADRVALLNEGRLEQVGRPEELYQKPINQFVAAFLGHPGINLVTSHFACGRLMPFGLEAPEGILRAKRNSLITGLRPEIIEISSSGPYAALVDSCEYMGDQYAAVLSYQGRALAVSRVTRMLEIGQEVRFRFDPARLMYFDTDTGANLLRS